VISNAAGLDGNGFVKLKNLILDHNSFALMKGFTPIKSLETLSISYNQLRDVNNVLCCVSENVSALQMLTWVVPEPAPLQHD
jgi:Leucine-rich repeat (LRR) protein